MSTKPNVQTKPAATKRTENQPELARRTISNPVKCVEVKAKRTGQDFLLGCTPEERAWCVRLVRLLRDKYWVTEFVRQVLTKEASADHSLTIKNMSKLLKQFDTIEKLAAKAQCLGEAWSDHPILRAVREEWLDIQDYKGELAIRKLIESATP